MKKILILLFIVVNFAFADYYFEVENSTMVEAYYNVFNAIAAIFNSDDYVDLLRFVFLIGGFFTFLLTIQKASNGDGVSSFTPYVKYSIGGVILLALIFSHKDQMWITTNNIPSYCDINQSNMTGTAVTMPTTLAFGFSAINKIGTRLSALAENSFYSPSQTGTPSIRDNQGYLGALKSAIQLQNVELDDVITNTTTINFGNAFQSFMTSCFYNVVQNKGIEAEKAILDMKQSKNIIPFLESYLQTKFTDSPDYLPKDNLIVVNGQHTTCGVFFESIIKTGVSEFKGNVACALPTLHSGVLELITKTPTSMSEMADITLQAGLIKATKQSFNINAIGISGADFAAGKTQAEANFNSLASATYMAEMLPYLQMTIRAILYAFFPFIFVTIIMANGTRVLLQYGKTLLWVELWGPTAAIVNMFVNLQVQEKLGNEFSANGMSMINSLNMLSEANTIAGVGAMLYLSIPPLTWLILTGSAQMIGNLAEGIGAKFTNHLSSEAQAQDFAKNDLKNLTGTSVSQKEKLAAQYAQLSSYSESLAFSNTGGLDYFKTQQKLDAGKFANNISKTENQDYVKNQSSLGEKEAGRTTGEIEAYLQNGGITAEQKLAYTNQDLSYKENKLLTNRFSNSEIAGSNFENKKENIIKTLEQKSSLEAKFGDSGKAYQMEGTKSAEDRKADLRKIDVNDDKKLTQSEISTYGSDVSTKAISDQNSLKAKNDQLLKEADNLANSSNADVKNTYEKYLSTFGSKEAAAAATLAAVQTKEQSFKGRETSQNIDTFNSSNISPEVKGNEGALQDVKDVNNKIENREQYKQLIKEETKADFEAQKMEILAKGNDKVMKEVIKNGVITTSDFKKMRKADDLKNEIAEFKNDIAEGKTTDWNGKLKRKEKELESLNQDVAAIGNKVMSYTNSNIEKINAETNAQLTALNSKEKDVYNVINNLDNDVKLNEYRGTSEGRKVETVNEKGEERLVIRDNQGKRVSDVNTAKMGLIRTGEFNYDASYLASKLAKDNGKNFDQSILVANTGYKYAKELKGAVNLFGK
ncbi:conjugal transfer protein TraG N-terminal domain-containing protein [Aliarcobacter cryaerophilus]|uniref:conjugal transfer protein TraG N-terminal domain-containing protein n=1 Tax=Aliarcobacter cryaerophilus TaxID=28198 RepID=UPI0021B6D70D|nr:conjugal transfer protein TraG N-terminal domain-containing protein [Aliarcobacter cryaerophilus]MCT7471401.1 conjugal transfer protein TraG N-terminal domain-containing protein [Aliarcobacter cryaerophilus]